MKKPTKKQDGFARDYVLLNDATEAYIKNYNCSRMKRESVYVNACHLLKKPVVAELVAQLREQEAKIAKEKFDIDAAYVLRRIKEIDAMDFADILDEKGALKPVLQWPKIWRTYISGFDLSEIWEGTGDQRKIAGLLKKIRWPDKVKNLELMGKHVNVSAFQEKILHVNPPTPQIVINRPSGD